MRKPTKVFLLGTLAVVFLSHFAYRKLDPSAVGLSRETRSAVKGPEATTEASLALAQASDLNKLENRIDTQLPSSEEGPIEKIENEDRFDIRVCENLGAKSVFLDGKKLKAPSTVSYGFEDTQDAIAMAMRLPYRAIYQFPPLKEYGKEVRKMTQGLDEDTRQKKLKEWGAMEKISAVVEQMMTERTDFEHLADRSVHLAVLAKVAALKPELVQALSLQETCQMMERQIGADTGDSIKKERTQILELLKKAQLSPEDVHFYPDHYHELTPVWSERQVSLKFVWKKPK